MIGPRMKRVWRLPSAFPCGIKLQPLGSWLWLSGLPQKVGRPKGLA